MIRRIIFLFFAINLHVGLMSNPHQKYINLNNRGLDQYTKKVYFEKTCGEIYDIIEKKTGISIKSKSKKGWLRVISNKKKLIGYGIEDLHESKLYYFRECLEYDIKKRLRGDLNR
jgi:hypothetical protein